MTAVEKIIAAHCRKKEVYPGDTLFVKPDLAVGSEIIFPQVLRYLRDLGCDNQVNPEQIALINGHLIPTKDAAAGTLVQLLDKFAVENEITNYFQAGRSGPCQTLLAVHGLVTPGKFVVGSDQHMTTYGALGALATGVGGVDLAAVWTTGETWFKVPETAHIRLSGRLAGMVTPKDLTLHILALLGPSGCSDLAVEIDGPALAELDMNARFTLANMMAESGAKFVYLPCDEVVMQYLHRNGQGSSVTHTTSDPGTDYTWQKEIDLAEVVPMVASPYLPTNGIPARDAGEIVVHQVIIGGCTNGEIEDFRMVAELLENRNISEDVKFNLYPATHQVIRDMLDEGLGLFFTGKNASISPPSCQPCLGSGSSMIGENEVGLYTTNRNYRGRHGSLSAKVYLSGPLVAAASAITGIITDPRDL